jgi:glucose-1-phosphate thymidylyltransferase
LESEARAVKVVIPVAGLGTRLRPHTFSKPKPLVHVAGKPVLGHILDQLKAVPVDEIIFITGYLGYQIEEYVRANYDFPVRFVEQTELRGQAHAIHLAAEAIDRPVLIIFVDTIIKADLAALAGTVDDGVLFVREVEDPRRFGVAVLTDGHVSRLVEKPRTPVSNLAVVGVYYLRNWQLLREALQEVIDRDIQTAGEYYLADALQVMIDRGARLRAESVEIWEDCGTLEALLQTNRYLLGNGFSQEDTPTVNSILIPPVYVARSARVENSILGPYASIADEAVVIGSIIKDSIVSDGARIVDGTLHASLVGSNASVTGHRSRLNVGDLSQVEAE